MIDLTFLNDWIALILGLVALVVSTLFRSSPSSLLSRQVVDIQHELKHLAKDIIALDEELSTFKGKVNQSSRKPKKKDDEEDAGDLTNEQKAFMMGSIEYQNFIKSQQQQNG